MIDTGASCSITPIQLDFTGPIWKCKKESLGSLTQVKTKVDSVGPVMWDIKDMNGVTRAIETTAYYVSSATIHLFSPQVYTAANPSSSLLLTHAGVHLTLACGTRLSFPVQSSNNLLFVLISKALKNRPQSKAQRVHVALSDRAANALAFLATSTYTYFWAASIDLSQAILLVPPPIKQGTFQRSNFNLSPAQKQLLLWHYRLGHLHLQHVQSLLAQQCDLLGKKSRIITPHQNQCSHTKCPLATVKLCNQHDVQGWIGQGSPRHCG